MIPGQVTVAARHRPPERAAVRVRAGDQVVAGDRDTEWPAFVFVTTQSGSGWVPSRHLSGEAGGVLVVHDYNTAELAVEPGDSLTVVERDEDSGWLWCRDASGEEGWIPLRVILEG